MTARSTTTATNEFSRLDRARRSLGCRQRPFILIAQLEQSQQDLIVGDRRTAAVVRIGRSVLDFLVQSDLFDGGFPGTVASRLFAEPRRLGDQTRAALPGEIAPHPLPLDAKPVLQLGQKEQVNKGPG
jgi:hypothetical protein